MGHRLQLQVGVATLVLLAFVASTPAARFELELIGVEICGAQIIIAGGVAILILLAFVAYA